MGGKKVPRAEIYRLRDAGFTRREIAEKLGLKFSSVKYVCTDMYYRNNSGHETYEQILDSLEIDEPRFIPGCSYMALKFLANRRKMEHVRKITARGGVAGVWICRLS